MSIFLNKIKKNKKNKKFVFFLDAAAGIFRTEKLLISFGDETIRTKLYVHGTISCCFAYLNTIRTPICLCCNIVLLIMLWYHVALICWNIMLQYHVALLVMLLWYVAISSCFDRLQYHVAFIYIIWWVE